MKKILFITNYPSPYRVKFFEFLGEHTNLTVVFEETADEQKHRNKQWFELEYNNFNAYNLSSLHIGKKRISFDIFRFLKREYDYIVVCGYSSLTMQLGILYMKLHRIPFYLEIDGGYPKSGKGILEWWKKILVSSAEKWFSPNTSSDVFLEFYGADHTRIIRYPFSSLFKKDILPKLVSKEEKEKLRKELGITESKVVLTIGQFIYRKANDILIKAASYYENEDIGTYIIGGTPTDEYIQLIQRLKLKNVHFIDFKKKDELMMYYRAADIFVMPTREDIWGLVINEALANGLPIVSTNRCMAAVELVEEGKNGYIVECDDPESMSNKLEILLSDQSLCRNFGTVSLKKIEGYTIEKMVEKHLEEFN